MRRSAVAAVVALIAVRIPFLLASADVQLSLLPDDAFYYLEAARRAVESGQWPSMDGRHATNGFHPLYMLLLVALQLMAGTNPRRIIPLVLGLNLLLNAVAAWIVARHWARSKMGLAPGVALMFLAITPGWMAHGLAGVENSLSSLLLLLVMLRWKARLENSTRALDNRDSLLDGALCGLAMLARTDTAIFIAACLIVGLLATGRGRGWWPALIDLSLIALATGLVVAPWLLLNWKLFNTIAQDSGVSIAFRFHRLAGYVGSPAWGRLALLSVAFWTYRLAWAWGLIPLTGLLVGSSLPWNRWRRDRPAFELWLVSAMCALSLLPGRNDVWSIDSVPRAAFEVGLGALAVLVGLRSPRVDGLIGGAWSWLAMGSIAILVFVYSAGFQAFQVWYSSGAVLILILLTFPALVALVRTRRALTLALMALLALQAFITANGYLRTGVREGMSRTALADGLTLRHELESIVGEAGGRVGFGSFDSGKLTLRPGP
jgi:4-amino-4-deoxy-L-arabinose transferase-like glycosyltransferase